MAILKYDEVVKDYQRGQTIVTLPPSPGNDPQ